MVPNPDQPELNHSRGYLPHLVRPGASYFITFRLADSLPGEVATELQEQLRTLELAGDDPRTEAEKRNVRKKLEQCLDAGYGACALADPKVAGMMCAELRLGDGQSYGLGDWVVMPNHVHVIVRPIAGIRLRKILQMWKGRKTPPRRT